MRAQEFLSEGGYASTLTQGTVVTPRVVAIAVKAVKTFADHFNKFLASKNMPPVEASHPVGSSHYYQRDLKDNPEKVYGDIDMMFFIPRVPDMSDGANASLYTDAVKDFTASTPNISTETGKNLIFKLGDNYVQVDLVMAYYDAREWVDALLPERGTKGVVSASIYSALAELLNMSISSNGVQVKLRDGQPVSFRQSKNTTTQMVSRNANRWALDILHFYANLAGIEQPKVSDLLKQYPGVKPTNIQIPVIVNAVKGLGQSLELNGLLGQGTLANLTDYQDFINHLLAIYTNKLEAAVSSSKFNKATSPEASAKATADKKKISDGLNKVRDLFAN